MAARSLSRGLRLGPIAGLAACLMLLAQPAHAQSDDDHEIGSRLKPRIGAHLAQDKLLAVRQAHRFAECVAHRRESLAMRLLNTTDPKVLEETGQNLSREIQCLNTGGGSPFATLTQFSSSTDVYRGNLAEALLEQMPKRSLPPLPLAREYHSPYTPFTGRDQLVEEMAVCIAATDPAGIEVLLRTPPEEAAEMQAIGALSGSMGKCLQTNARLTANRQSIRAALAEALYHRATGAKTVAAQ